MKYLILLCLIPTVINGKVETKKSKRGILLGHHDFAQPHFGGSLLPSYYPLAPQAPVYPATAYPSPIYPSPAVVTKQVPVPVPVPVERHIPVHVKVPVAVPVDRPYPVFVIKHVAVPVLKHVPVPVDRPVPVSVPVDRPVPVPFDRPVPVPQPYPVLINKAVTSPIGPGLGVIPNFSNVPTSLSPIPEFPPKDLAPVPVALHQAQHQLYHNLENAYQSQQDVEQVQHLREDHHIGSLASYYRSQPHTHNRIHSATIIRAHSNPRRYHKSW